MITQLLRRVFTRYLWDLYCWYNIVYLQMPDAKFPASWLHMDSAGDSHDPSESFWKFNFQTRRSRQFSAQQPVSGLVVTHEQGLCWVSHVGDQLAISEGRHKRMYLPLLKSIAPGIKNGMRNPDNFSHNRSPKTQCTSR